MLKLNTNDNESRPQQVEYCPADIKTENFPLKWWQVSDLYFYDGHNDGPGGVFNI